MSQAETRPQSAIEDLTAFLSAGTNVSGISLVWMVYPPHADAWMRNPRSTAMHGRNPDRRRGARDLAGRRGYAPDR